MIFLERDRAEILNLVADLSIRLIEAEEKIHALEKDASYWYERYKETRSNNDVQGVPFVAAPAGMPGGPEAKPDYICGWCGEPTFEDEYYDFAALWCARIVSKNAAVFCKERQYG